jgi:hypothetical protein
MHVAARNRYFGDVAARRKRAPFCYAKTMELETVEQAERPNAADEQEATYRQGLSRNWTLRFGGRADSLSRMSGIGDASALLLGALGLAATFCWPHLVPRQTLGVAIGVVVVGFIIFHSMNRSFKKLERSAFAEIEAELAGPPVKRAASNSPLYPLAKIVMKPRVRAKQAWVDQRMALFLSRREQKERQADIFEKQSLKLGSIHGTTGEARHVEHGA